MSFDQGAKLLSRKCYQGGTGGLNELLYWENIYYWWNLIFQLAGLTTEQKQESNNVYFLSTAKEVPSNELLNAVMEDIVSGKKAIANTNAILVFAF